MGLDGDGPEKLIVSPAPNQFRNQYSLLSGVGGDIEIATPTGYTVFKMQEMGSEWLVRETATLFKNGEPYKSCPSKLGESET